MLSHNTKRKTNPKWKSNRYTQRQYKLQTLPQKYHQQLQSFSTSSNPSHNNQHHNLNKNHGINTNSTKDSIMSKFSKLSSFGSILSSNTTELMENTTSTIKTATEKGKQLTSTFSQQTQHLAQNVKTVSHNVGQNIGHVTQNIGQVKHNVTQNFDHVKNNLTTNLPNLSNITNITNISSNITNLSSNIPNLSTLSTNLTSTINLNIPKTTEFIHNNVTNVTQSISNISTAIPTLLPPLRQYLSKQDGNLNNTNNIESSSLSPPSTNLNPSTSQNNVITNQPPLPASDQLLLVNVQQLIRDLFQPRSNDQQQQVHSQEQPLPSPQPLLTATPQQPQQQQPQQQQQIQENISSIHNSPSSTTSSEVKPSPLIDLSENLSSIQDPQLRQLLANEFITFEESLIQTVQQSPIHPNLDPNTSNNEHTSVITNQNENNITHQSNASLSNHTQIQPPSQDSSTPPSTREALIVSALSTLQSNIKHLLSTHPSTSSSPTSTTSPSTDTKPTSPSSKLNLLHTLNNTIDSIYQQTITLPRQVQHVVIDIPIQFTKDLTTKIPSITDQVLSSTANTINTSIHTINTSVAPLTQKSVAQLSSLSHYLHSFTAGSGLLKNAFAGILPSILSRTTTVLPIPSIQAAIYTALMLFHRHDKLLSSINLPSIISQDLPSNLQLLTAIGGLAQRHSLVSYYNLFRSEEWVPKSTVIFLQRYLYFATAAYRNNPVEAFELATKTGLEVDLLHDSRNPTHINKSNINKVILGDKNNTKTPKSTNTHPLSSSNPQNDTTSSSTTTTTTKPSESTTNNQDMQPIPFLPEVPFYIFEDKTNGNIVVSIRGTDNLDDLVTDVISWPRQFRDSYVHVGMFSVAQKILPRVLNALREILIVKYLERGIITTDDINISTSSTSSNENVSNIDTNTSSTSEMTNQPSVIDNNVTETIKQHLQEESHDIESHEADQKQPKLDHQDLSQVQFSFQNRPIPRIVFTGHSLGGGIACLMGLICREMNENSTLPSLLDDSTLNADEFPCPLGNDIDFIHNHYPQNDQFNNNLELVKLLQPECIVYASPALVSPSLSEEMKKFVISVVQGDDPIPHLSEYSINNALGELLRDVLIRETLPPVEHVDKSDDSNDKNGENKDNMVKNEKKNDKQNNNKQQQQQQKKDDMKSQLLSNDVPGCDFDPFSSLQQQRTKIELEKLKAAAQFNNHSHFNSDIFSISPDGSIDLEPDLNLIKLHTNNDIYNITTEDKLKTLTRASKPNPKHHKLPPTKLSKVASYIPTVVDTTIRFHQMFNPAVFVKNEVKRQAKMYVKDAAMGYAKDFAKDMMATQVKTAISETAQMTQHHAQKILQSHQSRRLSKMEKLSQFADKIKEDLSNIDLQKVHDDNNDLIAHIIHDYENEDINDATTRIIEANRWFVSPGSVVFSMNNHHSFNEHSSWNYALHPLTIPQTFPPLDQILIDNELDDYAVDDESAFIDYEDVINQQQQQPVDEAQQTQNVTQSTESPSESSSDPQSQQQASKESTTNSLDQLAGEFNDFFHKYKSVIQNHVSPGLFNALSTLPIAPKAPSTKIKSTHINNTVTNNNSNTTTTSTNSTTTDTTTKSPQQPTSTTSSQSSSSKPHMQHPKQSDNNPDDESESKLASILPSQSQQDNESDIHKTPLDAIIPIPLTNAAYVKTFNYMTLDNNAQTKLMHEDRLYINNFGLEIPRALWKLDEFNNFMGRMDVPGNLFYIKRIHKEVYQAIHAPILDIDTNTNMNIITTPASKVLQEYNTLLNNPDLTLTSKYRDIPTPLPQPSIKTDSATWYINPITGLLNITEQVENKYQLKENDGIHPYSITKLNINDQSIELDNDNQRHHEILQKDVSFIGGIKHPQPIFPPKLIKKDVQQQYPFIQQGNELITALMNATDSPALPNLFPPPITSPNPTSTSPSTDSSSTELNTSFLQNDNNNSTGLHTNFIHIHNHKQQLRRRSDAIVNILNTIPEAIANGELAGLTIHNLKSFKNIQKQFEELRLIQKQEYVRIMTRRPPCEFSTIALNEHMIFDHPSKAYITAFEECLGSDTITVSPCYSNRNSIDPLIHYMQPTMSSSQPTTLHSINKASLLMGSIPTSFIPGEKSQLHIDSTIPSHLEVINPLDVKKPHLVGKITPDQVFIHRHNSQRSLRHSLAHVTTRLDHNNNNQVH